VTKTQDIEEHRPLAREIFGSKEPLFEKFLAAASINSAGADNVRKALKATVQYLSVGNFKNYHGVMGVELNEYQHIIKNEELTGPKVVPFHKALIGDWSQVPTDRHMKNLLFVHPTSSGGNFSQPHAAQAIVTAMADKLGWKPAELQAVLWCVEKARREGDAAHAMRGNEGRSFFRSAVHIDRYGLAVPVQLFGRIGVVMDIDNDLPAFLEAQKGPGKLPVIGGGRNDVVRRQFHEPVADSDRVIRSILWRSGGATGRLGLGEPGNRRRKDSQTSALQKVATTQRHADLSG
jgi:hypothetical protein